MKTIFVVALVMLGACYSPSLRDCAVACASAADCGGDQACTDGMCATPGTNCSDMPAPVGPDMMGPANDRCAMACTNGTCNSDGVCVIDCGMNDSCSNDVMCPPNVPCKVICGDRSCDRRVNCGMASSCVVECRGWDSCAEDVECGMGPCEVTCSGVASCKKKVKCKESCACDVTCVALTSCGGGNECPLMMDACREGRGCSSDLPGCDRCE